MPSSKKRPKVFRDETDLLRCRVRTTATCEMVFQIIWDHYAFNSSLTNGYRHLIEGVHALSEENEVICSDRFLQIKCVLMVLYLFEELEEHNIYDIGRVYQELGSGISYHQLSLLFRCGLTLSFDKGGLSQAQEHLQKLKPLCDADTYQTLKEALRNEKSFTKIRLSKQTFKTTFARHLRQCFGPRVLLQSEEPSIDSTSGDNKIGFPMTSPTFDLTDYRGMMVCVKDSPSEDDEDDDKSEKKPLRNELSPELLADAKACMNYDWSEDEEYAWTQCDLDAIECP